MANTDTGTVDIKILEGRGGIGGSTMFYRALVGSTIKYLEVRNRKAAGFWYANSRNHYQHLGLDKVPDGDWNVAQLVHQEGDNKLVVASVEKREMPDMIDGWSGIKVDVESLGEDLLTTDEEWFQVDIHLGFGHLLSGPVEVGVPRVLAFIDPWLAERSIIETENQTHRLIQGKGIATRFLGHVTENDGRVIGYMLEPVAARLAGIEDLEACQVVLRKLHELGIAHGHIDRRYFLILENGALLQGFHSSFKTSDQKLFAKEMADVEKALQKSWPKNTPWSELEPWVYGVQDLLQELHERDGGIHPVLDWEIKNEMRATVTKEEHWALLEDFQKMGCRWTDKNMENALECRQRNGGRWYPLVLTSRVEEEDARGS